MERHPLALSSSRCHHSGSSISLVGWSQAPFAKAGAPYLDMKLSAHERAIDLIGRMTLAEKISQMGSASAVVPRLGVPSYNWWNEALHGLARSGYATMFPQALGMAATWDAPLLGQIGDAIATEARAKNNEAHRHGNGDIYFGLTFWSPNINTFRDPLWGRGQETYGGNSFLTAQLGVRFIQGPQRTNPNYYKVIGSGRLPLTFYASEADLPDFTDYSMKNRAYPYFTGTPLYSFGFGLSYTRFSYGKIKLSTERVHAGDALSAEVEVKNIGKRAGEEVAELYLISRAAANDGLSPKLQLEGFPRVALKPGESRKMTFSLDPRMLSEVDAKSALRAARQVSACHWRVAALRHARFNARREGGVLHRRRGGVAPLRLALPALFALLCVTGLSREAAAEDGSAAWLRYAPIANTAMYKDVPSTITAVGDTLAERTAAEELRRSLTALLGRPFTVVSPPRAATLRDVIVVGSVGALERLGALKREDAALKGEEYHVQFVSRNGQARLQITGGTTAGVLYGVFHVLEEIATERPIPSDERQSPAAAVRWTDEWDNLNGTIERGYAGPSIFFAKGHVREDLSRVGSYARLLASVGINGCNINNVNADLDLLTSEHLREFARIAAVFRPWGVKLALSIDLASPQTVGGLPTFDPLDPKVVIWWQAKVDEIYTLVPDFGGFTVKADSEGRKGPSQYGRSPADAANVLARALAPHQGVVLYRGFVYNNHLDWHDLKADRARAGVDNFAKYDGQFEPNVVIQIKEGPIDFQTREAVSPLFAALRHTSQAIELQTSQEYTGQQRHMVWLPSMWKWVLDTDMRVNNLASPVKDIVTGRTFHNPDGTARLGGFISVTNVGLEPNWLHHPMAMANLYGFGKLAWNPDTKLGGIIDTWTRLTWGNDPLVVKTISALQLRSWNVYENYTGPNGMGTLTNILGVHFGPDIESAEHNGWGQWFRGEKDGVGMDRSAFGTGFIQQYPHELAATYESFATCPDDLLLFFHHVPYDYMLHSGKPLTQSVYDEHYAGALAAAQYVPAWQSLRGRIDDERYASVLNLFTYQAGHAMVWRDAVNTWFHTMSGIDDAQGRVGHDTNRIEAEAMTSVGYAPVAITPPETASGAKAVVCRDTGGCTLSTTVKTPVGTYDVAVQYFDLRTGISHYTLAVNGKDFVSWAANDTLPPAVVRPLLDGQTSTRFTAHAVALKPGDTLTLKGVPDLILHTGHSEDPAGRAPQRLHDEEVHEFRELAPVDYLELSPNSPSTPQ